MTRPLVTSAIVLALACFGGTDPGAETLEIADVVGSYTMTHANGLSLPARIPAHPNQTLMDSVFQGQLTLRLDGRYVAVREARFCSLDLIFQTWSCQSRTAGVDSNSFSISHDTIRLGTSHLPPFAVRESDGRLKRCHPRAENLPCWTEYQFHKNP